MGFTNLSRVVRAPTQAAPRLSILDGDKALVFGNLPIQAGIQGIHGARPCMPWGIGRHGVLNIGLGFRV